ncbi:MAG: MCE family protein [Gordonia sp.]|nr:MCE family protein [Gordonia sp. (in: high G+C Gram-positive bacteria)]
MKKSELTKRVVALAAVVVTVGAAVTTVRYMNAPQASAASARGGSGFCAEMADSIGLYEGNPVTQMGYQLGSVTSIHPLGDHVKVVFELDAGRSFPADVQVVTRSKSLLADRSLELVGNYAGGPTLRSGTCVEMDRTHTPKSISEITGSASDFIEALSATDEDTVESAITGLDKALDGTGTNANSMMRQAAAAARNPEQVTADIGSSIMNMAPLTQDALAHWGEITSILNQMPSVARLGTTLFGDVARFDRGVGWLVATIYDIQRNYGDDLWPLMQGGVAEVIHLAATRAPDLQQLYATVPSIAAVLNQQEASSGLSVPYKAPTVSVKGNNVPATSILDVILQTAGRR